MKKNVPLLRQLYYYLTSDCNCSCTHCWLSPTFTTKEVSDHYLAVSQFAKSIEQAKLFGLTTVKLTGGEPTLHPEFRDILALISDMGLRSHIETNGLKLTQKTVAAIKKAGSFQVAVSLDGSNSRTHDTIRGVSGAFSQTTRGITHLVEAGINTQIITTLTGGNFRQRKDMIKLAEDLKVSSLKFNLLQPIERGKYIHKKHGWLFIEDILAFRDEINQTLQSQTPVRIRLDIPMAFRSLTEYLDSGFSTCGIFNILGVLADGSYALCGIGFNVPELVFGHIDDNDLENIWHNNPILKSLRADLPKKLKGICGECLMKTQCLGACVAQNYYQSNDLMEDFWFCREADSLGLFPETRRILR